MSKKVDKFSEKLQKKEYLRNFTQKLHKGKEKWL
jgi:hypothetical protein